MALSASAQEAEASASDSEAQSAEEMAQARLYFQNGVELLQAENHQDAFRQFKLAYDASGGNWKVLGNLGLCALKLERDGEALDFYQRYLEEGGDEVEPAEKEAIQRELLLISGNMAKVELTFSEPAVRLRVSRQGSKVPAQIYKAEGESLSLGLRSGQITIVATSASGELTWTAVLDAQETVSHSFDFAQEEEPVAAVASAPAAATAESPKEDEPMSTLETTGWITGGVGVGALIGGVVTGVLSSSKESSAREKCIEDAGELVCPSDVEADFNSAETLAMMTNVLLIGGGVLTATGATLVIVGRNGSSSEQARGGIQRLEVAPSLSPAFAGLSAFGRF